MTEAQDTKPQEPMPTQTAAVVRVARPTWPPKRGIGAVQSPIMAALIDTACTGDAVQVPRNGHPLRAIVGRYASTLKRHGLRVRARTVDNDDLILWAEPRPPKEA